MTPTCSVSSPRLMVLQLLLRGLRLERDLRAGKHHDLVRRARRRRSGLDLQPHVRAHRPADELHHVIEPPADDVDQLARLALADGDDAVLGGDLARLLRGAARQDLHDRNEVVDELQRGADALVGQAHLDAVFLGVARREIARVRIEHVRERVHEILEDVVRGDLLAALEHALVALAQDVARFGPGLVRQHQRERVVLDALAPELVELVAARRPRRVLAVELEALLDREVGLVVEQRERVLDALAVALLEAVVDRERRLDPPGRDRIVELVAIALEVGDVAREKVAARSVERFEVAIEHQRGHRVVDRGLPVMRALEHAADETGHLAVAIRRLELERRCACGRGGGRRRAEQQHAHAERDGGDQHRTRAPPAVSLGFLADTI